MSSFSRYLPAILLAILVGVVNGQVDAQRLEKLRVFTDGYPRAYFFRASEGLAANQRVSYEQWEETFRRLMGIEGKVLDEEVPGRSARNIEFFTQFKNRHREQLLLLHFDGFCRDPRFETEKFFAGHWIYFNGSRILSDVPAEEGETDIRVDTPELYRVNMGRYLTSNEDVGLCMLDADGKPNWHQSEQVQLVAVDIRKSTIRVRRGCYGTRPRAFPGGRAYAAAHMTSGPWGRRSNLAWLYNYSTRCPRDSKEHSCVDIFVEDVAQRFSPGGELAAFDGIQFDVLMNRHLRSVRGRGADCDADGRIDNGFFDGLNTYGIGVIHFCRTLRQKMGDGKLILADGQSPHNQRAFRILNGIESEGWPVLNDWEIRDWSGGLNRHWFWAKNAHPPVFNYVNHKYTMPGDEPGSRVRPEVPFNVHRLVFAAALFTDSAICYSFSPPREPDEMFGVWDELWMGTAHKLGWLGQPLGPAVRLAERQKDLLERTGKPVGRDLLGRMGGADVYLALDGGQLKVAAGDIELPELRFRVNDVPCDGPDLFVSVTARAQLMRGYPEEMARLMWVGIAPSDGLFTRPELPNAGICLRGAKETEISPDSGAFVRWMARRALGGEERNSYLVPPPYKTGTGYTFWHRDVNVPDGGKLEFFTGMGEKSPERSDGVVFRVHVAQVRDDEAGTYTPIFEHTQVESRWIHHSVPLARWDGETVRLKFISDCGPNDNPTTDHSFWGDVYVVGPEGLGAITEPVRFMSWVNTDDFTSGFYFSNVKSKRVDLEFAVEGSEPVWISAVSAYAYPDAIYREFEHGLVLANPSPREYVFDLNALLPGQRLRRLQGSPEQDPVANDGSPVTGKLKLQPKEGLFLMKVE